MSIAPPSDIILDVAQAADPQRLQAATSKLAKMASGSATVPDDFATLLTQAGGGAASPPPTPAVRNSTLAMSPATVVNQPASPYRKFEAVLLQTFVQEIMPKDEQLFGDAASADISRSMMAEQLANQLAKSDRIGIARMIEKAHGPAPDRIFAHAPRRAKSGGSRSSIIGSDDDRLTVASPDPGRRCTLEAGDPAAPLRRRTPPC